MAKQNGTDSASTSVTPARLLSFDEIMRAPDHRTQTIEVPEWGGAVRLRTITIEERERWEQHVKDDIDQGRLYARFVALCMVDENDQRIVPEAQLEFFARRAAGPMKRVFDAAQKLNGIGEAARAEAKNA